MDMGWFDTVGHAAVIGSIQNGAKYVGFYDEIARALLNRRLLEGQMPEKPGEIAVESTVLDMLALSLQPGDSLEVEITPIDGRAETRQFILTGILTDQSADMSQSDILYSPDRLLVLDMPALLVCADEPSFQTGRQVVQRVMTLKPGKSGDQLINAWHYGEDDILAVVSPYSGRLNTGYNYSGSSFLSPQAVCVVLMGAALLLVCGIGIAGSMDSRLAQRVEQIGLLRAVGATSRQIRRMYGREAWLLALGVSPLALAAACAAVFAASRLLPDNLIFRPSLILLVPVLVFSVIVVVLSASLPLRQASKIMPMQILRDTRTLKKLRKVKSHRQFRPARLVSARQATLHVGRMIGPAALIGLTMAILLLATQLAAQISASLRGSDFEMYNYDPSGFGFCELIPERALTDGDMAQISSLPQVGEVRERRVASVLIPLGRGSTYFMEAEDDPWVQTSPVDLPTDYLTLDNGWQDGTDGLDAGILLFARHNWAAQQRVGTDKKLLPLSLYAVDADTLRDSFTDAHIDVEALDRGEQVLAYVPDLYRQVAADGQVDVMSFPRDTSYRLFRQNDCFHAGQSLTLSQLRVPADGAAGLGDSQEDFTRLYDGAQLRQATVSVGAVLTRYSAAFYGACLITTGKGAKAAGLDVDHTDYVSVRLSGPVRIEQEEALFRRIAGIAARGGMTAFNRLKSRREAFQEQRMAVVTFIAVCIAFLGAAVGLISGTIRRRVLADARAIGTLRAVGASANTIRSCYSGQVHLTLLSGGFLGSCLFGLYWRFPRFLPTGASPALIVGTQAAALAAVWCACMLMLNHSVHTVTKKSIIENIREL